MKKILITLLTSFMLVASIGYKGIIAEDLDIKQEVVLGSPEDVDVPVEVAEKVSEILTNFAWAYSEGATKFLYGACMSGGITGILSLSMDLLKLTGIFGESEEDIQRRQLNEKLDAIDSRIGEVSDKVDSLQESLNDSLKEIDSSLSDISVKIDKDNITNAAKIYTSLNNEKNNYENTLNSHIRDWYQNYNFTYTNNKLIIYLQVDEDHEMAINISKDVIIPVLDKQPSWNVEKIEEQVKNTFKDICVELGQANDSDLNNYIDAIYKGETWETLDSFKKANIVNRFADGGYNSLSLECARRIAYARSSDAKTYVSELLDLFTNYCNYLCETDGKYTSPLTSQYNIYSKLNAFQGDLRCSYTYDGKTIDTNLAKIARDKYIIELNDIGSFVTMIAIASESYPESSLKSLIYIPWALAEKKLQDTYDNFYHVDRFGRELDNYCYLTGTLLDFKTGHLECEIDMKFYAWENGFGTDIKSYRDTYMNKDFTFSIPNEALLSSVDMNRLYAYYKNIGGGVAFRQYLQDNKVPVQYDLSSLIITKFIGSRNFTSEDKVKMFIKNCHNNPDKYEGKDYLKGDTTTITNTSEHIKIRKKAVADTFDLITGESSTSKRVGAVASFYEKWTFKDDLVLFWDAEYGNPETKEELKFLAQCDSYFYSRDRYDKKSDDEERYISKVNYDRRYGTIISIPLDEYLNGTFNLLEGNFQQANSIVCLAGNQNITSDEDTTRFKQYVDDYKKSRETNEDKFNKALEELGISQEEYEQFAYGDSYAIYFDETKHDSISEETYKDLITYANNHVDDFISSYNVNNDKIYSIVSRQNNKTNIKLSNTRANKLIKKIIERDLDCKIVDSLPTKDQGYNVYYDDNLYVWDTENSVYDKYDNKAKQISKLDLGQQEGGVRIDTNLTDDNNIDVDIYPKKDATNFAITYRVNAIIAFELYIDGNGDINYRVHPLYDIKPTLTWSENKEVKTIEIPESIYQKFDFDKMKVMIPVVQLDEDNDNRALIYHYADISQLDEPVEKFNKKINVDDGKYSIIEVNTFSPFYVNSTSYVKPEIYVPPVTGVE